MNTIITEYFQLKFWCPYVANLLCLYPWSHLEIIYLACNFLILIASRRTYTCHNKAAFGGFGSNMRTWSEFHTSYLNQTCNMQIFSAASLYFGIRWWLIPPLSGISLLVHPKKGKGNLLKTEQRRHTISHISLAEITELGLHLFL